MGEPGARANADSRHAACFLTINRRKESYPSIESSTRRAGCTRGSSLTFGIHREKDHESFEEQLWRGRFGRKQKVSIRERGSGIESASGRSNPASRSLLSFATRDRDH